MLLLSQTQGKLRPEEVRNTTQGHGAGAELELKLSGLSWEPAALTLMIGWAALQGLSGG